MVHGLQGLAIRCLGLGIEFVPCYDEAQAWEEFASLCYIYTRSRTASPNPYAPTI